ncbi:ATP-dependent DNA helicase RecG [Fundicoccus sp. Sow4_F4]|uniref:ATP-dependent DNA helicase RecG n=1 Tax=Fundicoccus sp. Sow4_F4 TaxID=3438783 RepID=UPI003F93A4B1
MSQTKSWLDSLVELKGIGPVKVQQFQQIGIYNIRDLFFHFPFRYEDIQIRDIETILDQEKVTLKGKIVSEPVVQYFGRNKSRLNFRFAVTDHDIISVTFFNQPYLKNSIHLGETRAVYGKWQSNQQNLMGMKMIKQAENDQEFAPIYHTTKGLRQPQIIQAIKQAFEDYSTFIPEIIPSYLNDKYQMLPLDQALYQMHFPTNKQQSKQAQRKIIFQEFFLFQWRLQLATQRQHQLSGTRIHYEVEELKEVIKSLPYDLTNAQKKAVNEICFDLMANYPMRRMLQGDVGSGKTLVAFLAMIASVIAGYQTSLLVPTEILAKQHVKSFNRMFEMTGLRAELFVSVMNTVEKKQIIEGLASGRIRIVIGTHALIQESIHFKNLGLAIIDEQHRFGVGQRQAMLNKGQSEHSVNLLQMTATPIPRSLALSLYGELSVSTIDELPNGRKAITTVLADEKNIESVYEAVEAELDKGHQVYYVLPLIESSEHMEEIENVLEVAEKLTQRFFNYQVDVLHGQLDKGQQQLVMEQFSRNETQILVATTMVEVGVDVANATVIVIQSAERFGLAQLHQLRGRVGRSDLPSYCFLIAKPTTEQGKARMKIIVQHQDGFLISQEDMKIRGMGDVLGRNQSGLPQFRYANLFEDQHILTVAREEVNELLKHPEKLLESEHKALDQWVETQLIEA